MRDASQDGYGCWRGAMLAHHIFHSPCSLQILHPYGIWGIMVERASPLWWPRHSLLRRRRLILGGKCCQLSSLVPHPKYDSCLSCKESFMQWQAKACQRFVFIGHVLGLH